jgi:hypothetical protein
MYLPLTKFILRRILPAALLAMGLSATAIAAQPANDLGKAWPNARDVSRSPHWHVYVFERDGVRYVQVNDLNGNVRGAFAVVGGQYLVLPIGRDADRVGTPQQRAKTMAQSGALPSEAIYQDEAIRVMATPKAAGVLQLDAEDASTCGDPANCTGGHVM